MKKSIFKMFQINRLESIKEEFIRNIRHEAHTPLVGITSLGQVMLQSYDHLDEEQRRGLIEQIAEKLGSIRESSREYNRFIEIEINVDEVKDGIYKSWGSGKRSS